MSSLNFIIFYILIYIYIYLKESSKIFYPGSMAIRNEIGNCAITAIQSSMKGMNGHQLILMIANTRPLPKFKTFNYQTDI